MAASSTITLLQTQEWAKKFNFNRASAMGNFLEPAMTSANTVLQTIVGAPFAWRWNRAVIGFITAANQQDYTVFNYQHTTAVKLGWFTVDDAGNSQKCTTAGTTGSSTPSWNHTLAGTTTDGSVTWTNMGPLGNNEVTGSYSFAWMETSSVLETTVNNGSRWVAMNLKLVLDLEGKTARPTNIAAQSDDGLGNVTFRLNPVPGIAYPVVITVQQKPPLFTKTSQTWAPIPDEYSHIYNWGFLSLMWLFADDPRFGTANAKFVSALLGSNQGLTETQLNIFLQSWQAITGVPIANGIAMQQGYQARGG